MSLCSYILLKHFLGGGPRATVHAADNHLLKQNINHDHAASLGLVEVTYADGVGGGSGIFTCWEYR
jgi:hypothetical protein